MCMRQSCSMWRSRRVPTHLINSRLAYDSLRDSEIRQLPCLPSARGSYSYPAIRTSPRPSRSSQALHASRPLPDSFVDRLGMTCRSDDRFLWRATEPQSLCWFDRQQQAATRKHGRHVPSSPNLGPPEHRAIQSFLLVLHGAVTAWL